VLLVTGLAVLVYERNRLRAHWWAHRLVQTEDLAERGYYMASLAAVGNDAAGALDALSRNADPDVRSLAVFGLKRLPEATALEELGRLLNDPNADVRESAALALFFMPSDRAKDVLRRRAESQEPGAAAAVAVLGRSDSPADAALLCRILNGHHSPAVRAQAAESLAARLQEDARAATSQSSSGLAQKCDPFLALVRALADDSPFSGELSLEREIAAAASFAQRRGVPLENRGPGSVHSSRPQRTVADIAARGLSSLTGRTVIPQADRSARQQAVIADQCRRWFFQRRRHRPDAGENHQSKPADSSDMSTERPEHKPAVSVPN